jgi:biopolymer transport protein ExbB
VSWIAEAWTLNRDFLETGGWVLIPIGLVTFVMWTMILERYWYLYTAHRALVRETLERWWERTDRSSWHAHQIRRAMIAQVSSAAGRTVSVIKTLVQVCPLFGLLGTVTGMIEVFDAMAVSGNSNARAMASGVSRATIPTMAGMVAALSGVILSHQLDRRTKVEAELIAEHLVPSAGATADDETGAQ